MKNFKFILFTIVLFLGSNNINASVHPFPFPNITKILPPCNYSITLKPFGFITSREPATAYVTVGGAVVANVYFTSRSQSVTVNIPVQNDNTVATVSVVDMRVIVDGVQRGVTYGTFNLTFNVGGACIVQ
jgi:hypothetical protein